MAQLNFSGDQRLEETIACAVEHYLGARLIKIPQSPEHFPTSRE